MVSTERQPRAAREIQSVPRGTSAGQEPDATMLVVAADIFDEVISGTTPTWMSYSQYNSMLGGPDSLAVMAYMTNRGSTSPTIQVFSDDSNDGRNWVLGTSPLISTTFSTGDSLLKYAYKATAFQNSPGTYARFRVKLTNAGTQCRLKLSATGRTL